MTITIRDPAHRKSYRAKGNTTPVHEDDRRRVRVLGLMGKLGLERKDVAFILGMSASTMDYWMAGKKLPTKYCHVVDGWLER